MQNTKLANFEKRIFSRGPTETIELLNTYQRVALWEDPEDGQRYVVVTDTKTNSVIDINKVQEE